MKTSLYERILCKLQTSEGYSPMTMFKLIKNINLISRKTVYTMIKYSACVRRRELNFEIEAVFDMCQNFFVLHSNQVDNSVSIIKLQSVCL